jgi:hypothetical protein
VDGVADVTLSVELLPVQVPAAYLCGGAAFRGRLFYAIEDKLYRVGPGGIEATLAVRSGLWVAGIRGSRILLAAQERVNTTGYVRIYEAPPSLGSYAQLGTATYSSPYYLCSNDHDYDPDRDELVITGWNPEVSGEALGFYTIRLSDMYVRKYLDTSRYAAMFKAVMQDANYYYVTVHGHVGGDVKLRKSDLGAEAFTVPSVAGRTVGLAVPRTGITRGKRLLPWLCGMAQEGGSGTGATQGLYRINPDATFTSLSKPSGYEAAGIDQWCWLPPTRRWFGNYGDDTGYFNPPFGAFLVDPFKDLHDNFTSDFRAKIGSPSKARAGGPDAGGAGTYDLAENVSFCGSHAGNADTGANYLVIVKVRIVRDTGLFMAGATKLLEVPKSDAPPVDLSALHPGSTIRGVVGHVDEKGPRPPLFLCSDRLFFLSEEEEPKRFDFLPGSFRAGCAWLGSPFPCWFIGTDSKLLTLGLDFMDEQATLAAAPVAVARGPDALLMALSNDLLKVSFKPDATIDSAPPYVDVASVATGWGLTSAPVAAFYSPGAGYAVVERVGLVKKAAGADGAGYEALDLGVALRGAALMPPDMLIALASDRAVFVDLRTMRVYKVVAPADMGLSDFAHVAAGPLTADGRYVQAYADSAGKVTYGLGLDPDPNTLRGISVGEPLTLLGVA